MPLRRMFDQYRSPGGNEQSCRVPSSEAAAVRRSDYKPTGGKKVYYKAADNKQAKLLHRFIEQFPLGYCESISVSINLEKLRRFRNCFYTWDILIHWRHRRTPCSPYRFLKHSVPMFPIFHTAYSVSFPSRYAISGYWLCIVIEGVPQPFPSTMP